MENLLDDHKKLGLRNLLFLTFAGITRTFGYLLDGMLGSKFGTLQNVFHFGTQCFLQSPAKSENSTFSGEAVFLGPLNFLAGGQEKWFGDEIDVK